MDQSVSDIIIQNLYPESETINVTASSNEWNITVWKDKDGEVHILVADNLDGSQTNLVLGQNGFTQRC
jgi:hypothetical protein